MRVNASKITPLRGTLGSVVFPIPRKPAWAPYALGFALIATLIVSLATFAVWQDRQHYRERAIIATQNIARLLDETISSKFNKVDVVLQLVVEHYRTQADSGSLDAAKLTAYLTKSEALIPEIMNLRIADKAGVVRFGRAIPTINPIDLVDRDFFTRLRDDPNAELLIEGPWQTQVSKPWVITFARRLNAPDGFFAGIAYVDFSVSYFNEMLSSLALGPAGAATLRMTDLALVARFPTTRNAIGSKDVSPSLREIMAAHSEEGQYVATTVLDGIERSNAYRKLKRYPFYVLVGLGTEDYLAGWASSLLMSSVLAILAVLATGLIFRNAQRMVAEVATRKASEECLETLNAEQADHLRELADDLTHAEQRERDRLYALLHDEVQPMLVAVRLSLSSVSEHTTPKSGLRIAVDACEHVTQVLRVVRTLSFELSPPLIRESGLVPALESLRRWVEQNHGIKVDLIAEPMAEPESSAIRRICFNFVRELLLNIAKHADATQAKIELHVSEKDGDTLWVCVSDDGVGFDPSAATVGTGLAVIEQRLLMFGGALEMTSKPGQTVVCASLPRQQFVRRSNTDEGARPDETKNWGFDA